MELKTLESVNRFDLEQEIMKCWHVVDDLKLFGQRYMDGKPMTEDEVSNMILALETLYGHKFEQLWNTFEQCLKNKEL